MFQYVKKIFSFKGRASRKTFIFHILSIFLVQFICGFLMVRFSNPIMDFMIEVILLFTIVALLSVLIRRLHDINSPVKVVILFLVSFFLLEFFSLHYTSQLLKLVARTCPMFFLFFLAIKNSSAPSQNESASQIKFKFFYEKYLLFVNKSAFIFSAIVILSLSVVSLSVVIYQQNNMIYQLKNEVDTLKKTVVKQSRDLKTVKSSAASSSSGIDIDALEKAVDEFIASRNGSK